MPRGNESGLRLCVNVEGTQASEHSQLQIRVGDISTCSALQRNHWNNSVIVNAQHVFDTCSSPNAHSRAEELDLRERTVSKLNGRLRSKAAAVTVHEPVDA